MQTYALFDDSFFNHKPCWLPKKLYRAVCQRANPRSKDYMISLLQEKFPQATVTNLTYLPATGQIVLLYPDSIGLGFSTLEKKLKKRMPDIIVLNGRRRLFALKPSVHKLILHRFLEVTFIPEILLTPFILVYGIFIMLRDTCKIG